MFQSFQATTSPKTGGPRLAKLRALMLERGVDGFLIPRADAHQGEYVADCDKRLAWLTGFTGSAGFCAALSDVAGVFVDGRYRLQVRDQVDLAHFTPVDWPETHLGDWLVAQWPDGGTFAYDPWLHTGAEIDGLKEKLSGSGIILCPTDNLVDQIWTDRPAPPSDLMVPYPATLAGKSSDEKRAEIAEKLRDAGQSAVIVTQPEAIAWLLNTRGTDLGQTPVALAFGLLDDAGHMQVFMDPAKADETLRQHLGNGVTLAAIDQMEPAIAALSGTVLIDKSTAPQHLRNVAQAAGLTLVETGDPVALSKAVKNETELAGTRAAHIRDGVAVVEFLTWLANLGPAPDLTEIDVVKQLEACRAATGALKNISFDTICGSGPNGAIMHYRVTEETNRTLKTDELLLVDSGAQYLDGTTDITRTMAIGTPPVACRRAFTLVLKGMIAISRARWPKGLSGRDLDPLARIALWHQGMDFDHGTGHGVGVYLSVHEGPQRISKLSNVPLQAGMILSNEPGYYAPGEYGIRIENLVAVQAAPLLQGGDDREMLQFETLTWVPIDKALIDPDLMDAAEIEWLNAYHAKTRDVLRDMCSDDAKAWLDQACSAL